MNLLTCYLIDDDKDDQDFFAMALNSIATPVHCDFSSDAINALEKLNSETGFRPDFIFIDLNMPKMDGKECLSELKKIKGLEDSVLIIYSTSTDRQMIAELQELGAAKFISKPVSIDALSATLSQIFSDYGLCKTEYHI